MLTAQAIIQMKKEYFFPNAMHFYQSPPHFIRGEGYYLFDDKGRRYMDFFAGVTVVNCGHANETINAAAMAQIQALQHTSIIYLTAPMVTLAERLAAVLPGDIHQTFFCNSGTEANEGALLLARMATGKKGFIAFEGGLHGRSHLTMSVTGIPMWRIDPFLEEEVYFVPSYMQSGVSCSAASLRAIESILMEKADEIAACIVEPLQGNGGIQVPEPGFLSALKELLERYHVLMIADEVQTGFGRTGRMFAVDHDGVVPDIMTMAKALGNGFPIGAFAARPTVASYFNKPSASTLGGNPVSATAGIAVLDYIQAEGLCERSAALGAHLLYQLELLAERFDFAQFPRGRGLMAGLSLDSPERVDVVLEAMLARGFIIGKNGLNREVLAFQPPLIITKQAIDVMTAALAAVFESMQ
jgi:4-aminobutyrate aminotransferase